RRGRTVDGMVGIFERTTFGDAYCWDSNEPEWQSFEEATAREIAVEFSAGESELASSALTKRMIFRQNNGTEICPDIVVWLPMEGDKLVQCVAEAKYRKTLEKRDALAVARYQKLLRAEIARIYIPAHCKVRKGARTVAAEHGIAIYRFDPDLGKAMPDQNSSR
ncbi:MAG: hypothetical protein AAFN41_08065, partial [Planctomycetota bacterium]